MKSLTRDNIIAITGIAVAIIIACIGWFLMITFFGGGNGTDKNGNVINSNNENSGNTNSNNENSGNTNSNNENSGNTITILYGGNNNSNNQGILNSDDSGSVGGSVNSK